MAKAAESSSLLSEMFSARIYKKNQGRLARQLTAVALGLMIFYGCYSLAEGPLSPYSPFWHYGIPLLVAAVAAWAVYRAVNWPKFADFLISVEAEMDKVSWASRQELIRATVVVIVTMLMLGVILFVYDLFWQSIFRWLGILQT